MQCTVMIESIPEDFWKVDNGEELEIYQGLWGSSFLAETIVVDKVVYIPPN